MGGGINAVDRNRLEACIPVPDSGVAAFGVTYSHHLGERWVVPYRVEVRVLVHLSEIGIVVLDRLPDQLQTSLRKLTLLGLVLALEAERVAGVALGELRLRARLDADPIDPPIRVSNSALGGPVSNFGPFLISIAIVFSLPPMKNSSLPSRLQMGREPPLVEICHLPLALVDRAPSETANSWTYTSLRFDSSEV